MKLIILMGFIAVVNCTNLPPRSSVIYYSPRGKTAPLKNASSAQNQAIYTETNQEVVQNPAINTETNQEVVQNPAIYTDTNQEVVQNPATNHNQVQAADTISQESELYDAYRSQFATRNTNSQAVYRTPFAAQMPQNHQFPDVKPGQLLKNPTTNPIQSSLNKPQGPYATPNLAYSQHQVPNLKPVWTPYPNQPPTIQTLEIIPYTVKNQYQVTNQGPAPILYQKANTIGIQTTITQNQRAFPDPGQFNQYNANAPCVNCAPSLYPVDPRWPPFRYGK